MKKYFEDTFRHVTLFGENEEAKKELNDFLEEKGYDFEEENNGLRIAVKEAIMGTGKLEKNFKVIMTRVPESEKEITEEEIIQSSALSLYDEVEAKINNVLENIKDKL